MIENKKHKTIKFLGIKLKYKFYSELDKTINNNIKKYKYVHIMYNDKFTKPFVDFLNRHFDTKEHMVLCYRRYENVEPTLFPEGENVYEYVNLNKINLKHSNIEKIICHSLFSDGIIDKLYKEKNLLKKSYWVIWGGDLYNAPRDKKNDFVRQNFLKLGVETTPDIKFYEKTYGKSKQYINVLYIYPLKKEFLDNVPTKQKKETIIQINNSCDKSILETLDNLAKYKDENIKIKTILSYGDLQYKQEIINRGKSIFNNKFEYLDKLLSPQEYANYISENDILILNQNRQQGLGNTFANLYLGNKVFIKQEISTSQHLLSEGITLYDTNKIENLSYEEFVYFSVEISEKNKEIVSRYFDEEHLATLWQKLFNDIDTLKYWEDRVKKHGKRSVYNMGHKNDELEEVDSIQTKIYSEVLKQHLNGKELTALDFGCGIGRFSNLLSELVQNKVYAVDPIKELFKYATPNSKVEYQQLKNNHINLPDNSIDLVFVSLVLGGITNIESLTEILSEFKRVSKPDALFFIVENTEKIKNSAYWNYRTVETYTKMFDFADINLVRKYTDLNEEISIFAGRKNDTV